MIGSWKNHEWCIETRRKIPLLIVILLISFIIALISGKYSLTLNELYHLLISQLPSHSELSNPRHETVFWQIRFPRTLAAIVIGGGLAIAGAAYQGMFRNPLVSPDILGVSAGAGVGLLSVFFWAIIILHSDKCIYWRPNYRYFSVLYCPTSAPT